MLRPPVLRRLACAPGLRHDRGMRRFTRLTCCGLLLALTACTQFPELDSTRTPGVADAPYPALVPLDTLLDGAPPRANAAVIGQIEGRVAGLRARASRLQSARVGPAGIDARAARLRQRAEALRRQ